MKIINTFKHDKSADGWSLLENKNQGIASVKDLELYSCLKGGEGFITGDVMIERAEVVYGQEDAEWLLEHQKEIPKEWQGHYIVFTGTVWQDSDGDRLVACLRWDGGRWVLDFFWLVFDWFSAVRLVRFKKNIVNRVLDNKSSELETSGVLGRLEKMREELESIIKEVKK